VELVVADDDARLGSLIVEMPPGRPLRREDLVLLQDLADAAAVAFRGARLAAELTDRVDELRRRAVELEASRRRLLTAGDVERDRLAEAIDRDVVPHLAAMPDQLAALAREDRQPPVVEPLILAAVAALDALRSITRGVYPAQLVLSGLEPALRSSLSRDGAATLLIESLRGLRFAPAVEAAAYYCAVEAERRLSAPMRVEGQADLEHLRLRVTGGADGELPLAAMRDRVEAVGGVLGLSGADGEVLLEVVLPAGAPPPGQPGRLAAQAALSASGPMADLVR
jgi:signal transduction histidine kinase